MFLTRSTHVLRSEEYVLTRCVVLEGVFHQQVHRYSPVVQILGGCINVLYIVYNIYIYILYIIMIIIYCIVHDNNNIYCIVYNNNIYIVLYIIIYIYNIVLYIIVIQVILRDSFKLFG